MTNLGFFSVLSFVLGPYSLSHWDWLWEVAPRYQGIIIDVAGLRGLVSSHLAAWEIVSWEACVGLIFKVEGGYNSQLPLTNSVAGEITTRLQSNSTCRTGQRVKRRTRPTMSIWQVQVGKNQKNKKAGKEGGEEARQEDIFTAVGRESPLSLSVLLPLRLLQLRRYASIVKVTGLEDAHNDVPVRAIHTLARSF